MMKKTRGTLITELRKEHGMTQAQLAEQMGVTDKAVSKWERDLSCPDINSIPKLAEVLGTTVEQLMEGGKSLSLQGFARDGRIVYRSVFRKNHLS